MDVTKKKTASFDFDAPIDRRGTSSLKWERYGARDILPLWVADMDFRSPPAVIEALKRRADHGVFGYTLPPAELVETVVAKLKEDFHWSVEPEWLVWLPGLVTGLNLACRTAGEDGDEVLTAVPVYPPFLSAPAHSRRRLKTVPLVQDEGRWGFDFDRLERSISPHTRLLLLCSPHNPVGRVFSRGELEALCAIAARHDLLICSDEIHAGLVLEPGRTHVPTASLDPETARRTITLMAPSKTFNLPGLGCAFAVIADAPLRRRFRRAMAGIVPHVNALGFAAALAAYRDGEPWHRALLAYLRGNRDAVFQAVRKMPGLAMTPVEATYLAWIDTRGAQLEDPVGFFEAAGVGLSDGREFGAPGFVRLNFGSPRALLEEALARMGAALNRRSRRTERRRGTGDPASSPEEASGLRPAGKGWAPKATAEPENPAAEELLPVFVYGTLRPGQKNYPRFLQGKTLRETPATTGGRLFFVREGGYPYVLPETGSVAGDLVELAPATYAETLARLDELEEYRPWDEVASVYLRRRCTASLADGSLQTAWIYLWNGPPAAGERIASGDFRKRRD